MAKKHTLRWLPLDDVQAVVDIPFIVEEGGRIVFSYPAGLAFGVLELNGVQVTGYFLPDDDETEFSLRPWILETENDSTNEQVKGD